MQSARAGFPAGAIPTVDFLLHEIGRIVKKTRVKSHDPTGNKSCVSGCVEPPREWHVGFTYGPRCSCVERKGVAISTKLGRGFFRRSDGKRATRRTRVATQGRLIGV